MDMGTSSSAPWRKTSGLNRLRAWRSEGLTYAAIAKKMDISADTLRDWRKKYPELGAALSGSAQEVQAPAPAKPEAGAVLNSKEIGPLACADLKTLARGAGLLPLDDTVKEEQVEALMKSALLRRALGYCYSTVTSELRKDPVTGENVMTVTKRIDKEVPPDTSAQLFWLKSRFPDHWRDKHTDEAPDTEEVHVTFDVDEEEDPEDGWGDDE